MTRLSYQVTIEVPDEADADLLDLVLAGEGTGALSEIVKETASLADIHGVRVSVEEGTP